MEAIKKEKEEPKSVAQPFQRNICPKSFVYKSSLEEHILNEHVVAAKEFQCAECLKTNQLIKSFATQGTLNKHIKRAHEPPRFKCQICFKTFKDASNLANHKKLNHSRANLKGHIKCGFCSKATFSSNQNLQSHLFYVHKQRREDVNYFKCELCSREFLDRSNLELHVIRQHVVDKAFECPVCSKKFIDQETLDKHMKRHDGQNKYFCDICPQGFIQTKSLVKHLGVKHNHFFYCNKKCLRSFKIKSEFDEHISDSKQELKCYICQEIINSECNLKIHTDSHVNEIKTKQNQVKIETQTKPGKTCNKLRNVEATKFECPLCSKTFNCEAYFTAHRNQVHRNAEWKCDFEQCSKSFRYYRQLSLHKLN